MFAHLIPTANAAADAAAFGKVLNPILSNIVSPIIMLMFAVALVVFVYGVAQMIIKGADTDEYEKGKKSMLYGLIGIFIMVSVWGIINLVANTVKQF